MGVLTIRDCTPHQRERDSRPLLLCKNSGLMARYSDFSGEAKYIIFVCEIPYIFLLGIVFWVNSYFISMLPKMLSHFFLASIVSG